MGPQDDQFLFAADVSLEALAMNEAALHRDFDEARFRARLVAGKARAEECWEVALLAAQLVRALGEPRTEPPRGYGELLLGLAYRIDRRITTALEDSVGD